METPKLKELSQLLTSVDGSEYKRNSIFLRKLLAGSILLLSDILAITFALVASLLIKGLNEPGYIDYWQYMSIMPFILALFPLAYFFRGLYPGFGIDVIEELKNLTYSTTIVFAVVATMSFLVRGSWEYSRFAFLLSWLIALPIVPIFRSIVKKFLSKKSWWGIPVIIIGAGKVGEKVIKSLRKQPHIGLRPIIAVDDDSDRWGYIDQIPVIGGLNVIPKLVDRINIDHAIIAMPSVSRNRQKDIIQTYSRYFSHTIVIPDLFGLSSLWVSTRDIGGILGLEVQQRLLKISSLWKKRLFDIIIASILVVLVTPLILIVSVLIKLDSRGKIFFRQERMGIGHSRFNMIKLRTMHFDAEKRLSDLLDSNPELRAEYEIYHKLKNDPRLTRVGKFLRKFSIDELPQFWNVIKGEMSLIGPRAYMPWEMAKLNGQKDIIFNVKPGVSGLWQVTERNSASFEERTLLDVYYIRNWSMFLDFYILTKTIAVVLSGRRAY